MIDPIYFPGKQLARSVVQSRSEKADTCIVLSWPDIVCSGQTIVCWDQTMVWREQTMVCWQQTSEEVVLSK